MSDQPAAVTYHGPSYGWLYGNLSAGVDLYLRGVASRDQLEQHYQEVRAMADAGERVSESGSEAQRRAISNAIRDEIRRNDYWTPNNLADAAMRAVLRGGA